MRRVDGESRGRSVELAAEFVPQSAGGVGRERDGQDARGISCSLAKVSDPRRENCALPTSWTGDDGDWSIAGGNRLLLRGGEPISHTARSNGVVLDDQLGANEDRVVAMGIRVLP